MPKNPILDELLKAQRNSQGNVATMFGLASDALVRLARSGGVSEAHILEALGYLEGEGQALDKYFRGCIACAIVLSAENCWPLSDATRFIVNWVGCRSLADAGVNRDVAGAISAMAEAALKWAPPDAPVQIRVYLLCQLAASRRVLGDCGTALTTLSQALSLCRGLEDPKTQGFEPDTIRSHLAGMAVLFGLLGDKDSSLAASDEAARWAVQR
jgi:hypothetical protein